MPADPFLRALTFFGLGIVGLSMLAGLASAVAAPFWAYRYVRAPERAAPHRLRRWLWETAKVELFGAMLVVAPAAFVARLLSHDTALLRTIGIANLALSLMLAVAVPVAEYDRTADQQTRGRQTARHWLIRAAESELLALYVAMCAALVLWPEANWPFAVISALMLVLSRRYIFEFASQFWYAVAGAFHDEYRQYVERYGRNSEMELQMQMHMHGGQLDVDATEGEGGNAIP